MLNENTQYRILTNSEITMYPRFMMMISRAKEAHRSNLELPFINFRPQQEIIKATHNENIEPIQNTIETSNQNQVKCNSPPKENINGINEMPQSIENNTNSKRCNPLLNETNKPSSSLSFISNESRQEIKKAKYASDIELVQDTVESSNCNRIKLNSNLAKASKNAFNTIPKSINSNTKSKSYNTLLADIKSGKSFKIIAQVSLIISLNHILILIIIRYSN
jgi:hypothetical protein